MFRGISKTPIHEKVSLLRIICLIKNGCGYLKRLIVLICAGLLVVGTVEFKTANSVSEATTTANTIKSTNGVASLKKAATAIRNNRPKLQVMVEKQKQYCAAAISKNQPPKQTAPAGTKIASAAPVVKKVNSPTVSRGMVRMSIEDIVRSVGDDYWNTPGELEALVWIWKHESVRPGIVSRTGCKGLFQLKNPPKWMKLGDPLTEAKAGCEYIKRRYKSPMRAKAFWQRHHWY
jgi:hypothetical protein